MVNTIRVIYKNDEGEQYTVNVPLLKKEDVQLVFKSSNIYISMILSYLITIIILIVNISQSILVLKKMIKDISLMLVILQ